MYWHASAIKVNKMLCRILQI